MFESRSTPRQQSREHKLFHPKIHLIIPLVLAAILAINQVLPPSPAKAQTSNPDPIGIPDCTEMIPGNLLVCTDNNGVGYPVVSFGQKTSWPKDPNPDRLLNTYSTTYQDFRVYEEILPDGNRHVYALTKDESNAPFSIYPPTPIPTSIQENTNSYQQAPPTPEPTENITQSESHINSDEKIVEGSAIQINPYYPRGTTTRQYIYWKQPFIPCDTKNGEIEEKWRFSHASGLGESDKVCWGEITYYNGGTYNMPEVGDYLIASILPISNVATATGAALFDEHAFNYNEPLEGPFLTFAQTLLR